MEGDRCDGSQSTQPKKEGLASFKSNRENANVERASCPFSQCVVIGEEEG